MKHAIQKVNRSSTAEISIIQLHLCTIIIAILKLFHYYTILYKYYLYYEIG